MKIDLKLSRKLFNDAYFPYLLDYSKRYEVYYGSAGSGKSHFVFQKIVVKALREVRKVLVIRKTAKSNLNSTFQMTLDTLSKFKVLAYCNINRTTLTITLPNGSVFLFYGCDDSEKLKSIAGITDIICEEATELTTDDVSQLDLRLRPKQPHPQMIFMFNPVSKTNWVYKRWFDENSVINEDTMILKTTYKDNRFLPPEYIKSLMQLKEVNPAYYKIYVEGDFCSLDKLVYTNWKVEDFDRNKTAGQLLIGLDFGFTNDPTALVASLLDKENKRIYVFKEWGATGKTNEEIAEVIKALGFAKSTIIADAAEPKSVEEIRRLGVQRIKASVKGGGSILHGIQKLQQYQLIIHPSCEAVKTELENYSWQKDKHTNEYINKPIDQWNHYLDALRYSLQCVQDGRIRTINKAVLGL